MKWVENKYLTGTNTISIREYLMTAKLFYMYSTFFWTVNSRYYFIHMLSHITFATVSFIVLFNQFIIDCIRVYTIISLQSMFMYMLHLKFIGLPSQSNHINTSLPKTLSKNT